MARVSEGSSFHAINHAVGKTKQRLEDLQLKGSSLKKVQKPSDDPVGNTEILAIRSQDVDAKQYLRNVSYAKAQLTFTENAIEELTDLVTKAKEIAIGQSSNLFGADIRKSVATEVSQLRQQAISISNRRLGNKYIFGGYKTLTKPFNSDGNYLGDKNQTQLEVSKDFFVPVNFSGKDIFFEKENTALGDPNKLRKSPLDEINKNRQMPTSREPQQQEVQINRNLASTLPLKNEARKSLFGNLKTLENALITNNNALIQDLLPDLDDGLNRLIEVRTKIGSIVNSVDNAENKIEKTKLMNAEYKSKIEDADVAELFTDLTRQKNVLDASYKISAQMMNQSLMNFIR